MKPCKISYESLIDILNKNEIKYFGRKYAHSYYILIEVAKTTLEFSAINDEVNYCAIDGTVREGYVTDIEYLIKSWKLETL